VIDLAGVAFMDSTGLREILRARNELAAMSLRAPSDTVRRLLDITGLTDHIEIDD
jgi:stage II sporulation protein AA (anti-sigma F factor antagonist)